MFKDETGEYAETMEEIRDFLGEVGKQIPIPEFELIVKELVEGGYIDYIEDKGYILSNKGVRTVKRRETKGGFKWPD